MRRRPADYRRPGRRRFSVWIWLLVALLLILLFCIAGFMLLVVYQNQQEYQHHPSLVRNDGALQSAQNKLNLTKEITNSNSYARQLLDQITLAKAYIVIAKEHNNHHLAWELASKIRSCQFLLSKAAMRDSPLTQSEAEPLIESLSTLIFKAQDAHYDIATTIMTMKSHIQALEERAIAATVQSTFFGQLAAESVPKNLHCVNVKLLASWLTTKKLHEVTNEIKNSPRLACGWAFGLNVFDLVAWRNANVTELYHYWQEQNSDGSLWRLGTLPPALLAFYGRTEPLDRRWHVLGLGYDVNIDNRLIESAAVVHFNGNLKPWLKFGIKRYKPLWERYVNQTHPFLLDCVTN